MTLAADASVRRVSPGDDRPARPRSAAVLIAIGIVALVAFSAFVALGVWQLERRVWKLDLIERVDARIHAAPVSAPGPGAWPLVTAAGDEYRRLKVEGAFLSGEPTLVQAVTDLGAGFWAIAPFRTAEGFVVLVNRGFVPPDRRDAATLTPPEGPASITGLMRMSEPNGAFLRDNDPSANLWRSRDVAAIADARGLTAAPYFIDADATPNAGGWPRGGLTVVAFRNSHLVYALTWFALALMVAGGVAILARHERGVRRQG